MSRTSIFEKRWLDLVFEGRNKAYGAYQLRLENPRTTLLAMFYGILFVGGISAGGFLLSSFGSKTEVLTIPSDEGPTVVVDYINQPERRAVENEKIDLPEPETAARPEADWRNAPVVSAPTDDLTSVTNDSRPSVGEGGTAPGAGSGSGMTSGDGSEGGVATGSTDAPETEGPTVTSALDKIPMFPGGMERFYSRIAMSFEKPETFENSNIRIIVSFVIEKDGSMTDIKVISKTDASLERETLRVLRSINKKWEPGVKNGKNMRTLFTLPIVLKPQQQ